MKSVAVFCGSAPGNDPAYAEAARALGAEIAARGMKLVFGGGKVGLMGIVADACLAGGGKVVGIIPRSLMDREVGHLGVTQLTITGSMHERKAAMERAAEGFIMLPGGFGTLDEYFEILTWAQLGIHRKPCAVLDSPNGYFDSLFAFIEHATAQGFVKPEHAAMIMRDTDSVALLDRMQSWQPQYSPKWVDLDGSAVPEVNLEEQP